MALIRMDHLPETIRMNIPLNVIVPEPFEMQGVPVSERKVLYLLHGLSDDASAWQRYSMIEIIARAYGLVVVMPTVTRSFYIDQANGQQYFTYIVDELPRYLHEVFGIVPNRENTLLAGLSMGGYGAIKAALLRPQQYSAVAAFSGVLSLNIMQTHPDDSRQEEFALLFGDLTRLDGSEHDPAVWLRRAAQNPAALPKLFIACGRQDDLYPLNVMFNAACQKLGVPLDYHEEDGKHDWPFWNTQIQRFLALTLGPMP
jgi:putative tributyrin esterase